MNELKVRLSADTQQFEAGIQKAQTALAKMPNASNQATIALSNLSRVAQDAPYGFIGIANNINPLLESFQRLKATTGTTGGALKALGSQMIGPAGLGLAIGVASSLLVTFGDRLFGSSKKMQEADDAAKKLSDSVKNIFEGAGKEAAEVNTLIAVLNSETETRKRKLAAIQELQKIQPDVFNNLKLEGNAVVGLDTAYQNYLTNLKTTIAVKIKQAQLEQLLTKQLQLQGVTLTQNEKSLQDGIKAFQDFQINAAKGDPAQQGQLIKNIIGKREQRAAELKALQDDIDKTMASIGELSRGIVIDIKSTKVKTEKLSLEPRTLEIMSLDKQIKERTAIKLPAIGTAGLPIGMGTFNEMRARAEANLAPIREELLKLQQTAMFVGNSIADVFSSAFDAIANGQNPIKAIGEAIKGLVMQLIQAAIRAAILSAIMNIIAPGSSAAKGGFSGMFSQLLGFGGMRAGGGPVNAGTGYLVGERGPELFVPSTSGRIVPNHQTGSILGSAGQMFNVLVTGRISGRDLVLVQSREGNYQTRNA